MAISSERMRRLALTADRLAAGGVTDETMGEAMRDLTGLLDAYFVDSHLVADIRDALAPEDLGTLSTTSVKLRELGRAATVYSWNREIAQYCGSVATILKRAADDQGAPSTVVATIPTRTSFGGWVRDDTPLGSGGQANVYLARNPKSAEVGALKIMREDRMDDRSAKRFVREMAAFEKLKGHPGVAALLDFSKRDLWMVTRWAPYGALQRHLALYRGDAFRTLRVARDVALALGAAHGDGIIHRDLKPANLLLYSVDHVALADFGIAHVDGDTHLTTERPAATRWYGAPETWAGDEPKATMDVYSLGKVIYAMLSGGKRFGKGGFESGPEELGTLLGRPRLTAVTDLLRMLVQEDPADRPSTMERVVRALDETIAMLFAGSTRSSGRSGDAAPADTVVRLQFWRGGDEQGETTTTYSAIDQVKPTGYGGRFEVLLRGDGWHTVEGNYKEFLKRWTQQNAADRVAPEQ